MTQADTVLVRIIHLPLGLPLSVSGSREIMKSS
jgi:hypothetical protein